MKYEKKIAFTLAEMMVVMIILTIILAASAPIITKRATHRNEVRIITVPATQQIDKKEATSKELQQKINNTNSSEMSQEVTNIEIIKDENGKQKTLITTESGLQYTMDIDEKVADFMQTLNKKGN